jgi:glycosyltransferase involved in cell wall biosynthesis
LPASHRIGVSSDRHVRYSPSEEIICAVLPASPAPAAIISQLPLDVVGGGERFTLQAHRSALACGDVVDLWCAAAGNPPMEPHARRMDHAYHRLAHGGGTPVPIETVPLRELLRRQAAYETVVVHQHLVNASTLDMLSAAPPTQRMILTSLGAEPIGELFAKAYEPHSGLEIVEISAYAASRATSRGMPATSLSAGVWRSDIAAPIARPPAAPLRTVAIGRLLPHKAFEIAIDAVAGIDSAATLTIIGPSSGDTAYEQHLATLAARTVNCRVAGFLDDAARTETLTQADVLLANSAHVTYTGKRLDQPELLGLVILEAIANGVLPICSDIPSFREICEALGIERWLYPERDSAALRELVRAAAELAPEARRRIVRTAAERLENMYLWDDYWVRLTRRGIAPAHLARAA